MAADKNEKEERSRLVKPFTLLAISVVLIVALVLLFPARHFQLLSHEQQDRETVNSVSITYLEALLRANPDDDELRINLASQLARAGEIDKARAVVAPLDASDDPEVQWLQLEIAWQAFNATQPTSSARAPRRRELAHRLAAVSGQSGVPEPRLEALAARWLAISEPAQAAEVYERLAVEHPQQAFRWYGTAARWWLAADRADQSALAWQSAFTATQDPKQRRTAALAALKAVRQSDRLDGLGLATRFIKAYPNDPEFLDIGIDLALAHNQLAVARSWSKQYVALRPDDRKALARDTRIALALNQLQDALAGLQKLVADNPNDAQLRAQLAQVLMWSGQQQAALDMYVALARSQNSDVYDDKVIVIAQQVHSTREVLAALDRIRHRHPLNASQRTLLVNVLNSEGEPQRAIEVIQGWIHSGPAPQALWERLATLDELTGDRAAAIDTWQKISQRFGRGLNETLARGRLNFAAFRMQDALDVLASLPDKPRATGDKAVYYWSMMGELAWNLGDKTRARDAYAQLFATRKLTATGYQRLVRSAADTGQMGLAMKATRRAWTADHDPQIIIVMLGAAERNKAPDLTRQLLAMAATRQDLFVDNADYWQFYGDYQFAQRNLPAARAAYLKSLAIDPGNAGNRAALLYTLAEGGWLGQLRQYLDAWAQSSGNDPNLWQAFAMGYSRLGDVRRATPWFDRSVQRQPSNYLLILDYADALEAGRRFESARRMRQYALIELRPRLLRDLQAQGLLTRDQREEDSRILNTQAALLGAEPARAWLAASLNGRRGAALTPVDIEMLFGYYLSQEQPAYARYWLLQGQRRRLQSQDWARLAVALDQNDQPLMQRLIAARGDGTIGISDRINTLRQLDFRAEALTIALDHERQGEPYAAGVDEVPRYAAELYREMPQNYGTSLIVRRINDLDLADERVFFRLSGEKWSVGAQLGDRQLQERGTGDADIHGLDNERYATLHLFRRERRGLSDLMLGTVLADDKNIAQAGFIQQWQFTNRLNGNFLADYNQQPDETGQLRVLGLRDNIGGGLDYALTARDLASISATYQRFYSREGRNFLADGYTVETALAHSLIVGPTYQFQVRAFANTEQNSLRDDLPADLARRLPLGADIDSVVPPHYSFVGSGFTFSRGEPGAEYPLVASPRYALDVDAGYTLPDDQFGISANFSAGISVLGSDELSFNIGIDQTGSDTRQNSYTGMLKYQYFLGR